jgi:hypothetical protein
MEKSGRGRKRGPAGRLGQAGDALRSSHPDLLVEDQSGKFSRSMQLTGTAG